MSLLLASSVSYATEHTAHWSYSGENGPGNWASLTPDFDACTGKNQTPVNLTGFIKADSYNFV